jgi:hypothetical protein
MPGCNPISSKWTPRPDLGIIDPNSKHNRVGSLVVDGQLSDLALVWVGTERHPPYFRTIDLSSDSTQTVDDRVPAR